RDTLRSSGAKKLGENQIPPGGEKIDPTLQGLLRTKFNKLLEAYNGMLHYREILEELRKISSELAKKPLSEKEQADANLSYTELSREIDGCISECPTCKILLPKIMSWRKDVLDVLGKHVEMVGKLKEMNKNYLESSELSSTFQKYANASYAKFLKEKNSLIERLDRSNPHTDFNSIKQDKSSTEHLLQGLKNGGTSESVLKEILLSKGDQLSTQQKEMIYKALVLFNEQEEVSPKKKVSSPMPPSAPTLISLLDNLNNVKTESIIETIKQIEDEQERSRFIKNLKEAAEKHGSSQTIEIYQAIYGYQKFSEHNKQLERLKESPYLKIGAKVEEAPTATTTVSSAKDEVQREKTTVRPKEASTQNATKEEDIALVLKDFPEVPTHPLVIPGDKDSSKNTSQESRKKIVVVQ
ncbi:MAG: hypothetical protein HQK51_07205, partial [Oligoflexia bacterium]|nr:hypothetical protein [Oligoflexia bacterium]